MVDTPPYRGVVNEALDIRVDFPPEDEAISVLHTRAFGGTTVAVAPWAARLERHSLTWAGVFHDDLLVAFVHVVWDGGAHGFLLDTAVHPDHQRRGLGRAVVAAVVQRSTTAGCQWLHVDYEPRLDSFYRQTCGFSPTRAGLLRLG